VLDANKNIQNIYIYQNILIYNESEQNKRNWKVNFGEFPSINKRQSESFCSLPFNGDPIHVSTKHPIIIVRPRNELKRKDSQ